MHIGTFTLTILPVFATVFATLAKCHCGATRRRICNQRYDCAQLTILSAVNWRASLPVQDVRSELFFFLLSDYK